MSTYEIIVTSQGSVVEIKTQQADSVLEAMNKVEAKVNPPNDKGWRRFVYSYEAREVTK